MGDVDRDDETTTSTQGQEDTGQLEVSAVETNPAGGIDAANAQAEEPADDPGVESPAHVAGEEAPGPSASSDEPQRSSDGAQEPASLAAADDQSARSADGTDGPEVVPPSDFGTTGAADDSSPLLPSAELKAIIEALVFASPEPLSIKAIGRLLDSEPSEDVEAALAELKVDYERPGGLQLVEVAGGFQIVTRPDLHEWVRRLFHERSTQRLSVQALETLAVIAYRQPITAAEVAEIRGVNTSGVLNTLLERHLVKIVGRKAVVGRPFMYATTREFLIRFGLNDIADLPKVQDMVDALGLESPLLVERVTTEEQLPLDEPDTEAVAEPSEPTGSPVSPS